MNTVKSFFNLALVAALITVGYFALLDPPPVNRPNVSNCPSLQEAGFLDATAAAAAFAVADWEFHNLGPVAVARCKLPIIGDEYAYVGVGGKWYGGLAE